MKKNFSIYILVLTIASFAGFSVQAQQQKKPSERSFTEEINKVKQIQAARNTMIRKTQQPVNNTSVHNNKQTIAAEQNQKTQVNPASKPSTGIMKQPKKPVISKE